MKKITGKILKTSAIVFLLLIIVSCVGIETEIQFKNDESGTVKIKYRVSQMVIKTAEIDSDSSFLPLPIEEKDFIEKADRNEDLKLVSYKREDNNEEIFITAEFSFSSIEALNAIAGESEPPVISVDKKLTRTVFTQQLYPGSKGNIDTETMQVVTDLYSTYPVKFTIIAPSDIKNTNIGNIKNNRAEIEMSVPDIISSVEPVIIELSW